MADKTFAVATPHNRGDTNRKPIQIVVEIKKSEREGARLKIAPYFGSGYGEELRYGLPCRELPNGSSTAAGCERQRGKAARSNTQHQVSDTTLWI
jgi:hypothetical protein